MLKSFGAIGDGHADDTAAILCAIKALNSKPPGPAQAGVILFSIGTYVVSGPLVIQNTTGVTLLGTGQLATALLPTSALRGAPVIKFVNCVNCAVRNLWIHGNTSSPPSAGIESQVDLPGSAARYPTNLLVRDVYIGNPILGVTDVGLSYGIRFTATPNSDGNNDLSTVSHVTMAGLGVAGISIEHSNSLAHRFDSLDIYYVPIGIQTKGGSFELVNSFLSVSSLEFNFLASQGTLNGKNVAGYYHPILISNTGSEGTSDLLSAVQWPEPGTPRADGVTGIDIYISNFDQKGTKVAAAGQIDTSINYWSPGKLSISNSNLIFGTDTNILANNPKSVVTLTGNRISAVHQIQFNGHLTSVGNYYMGGTSEFIPTAGAVFQPLGDFNDFPNGTN